MTNTKQNSRRNFFTLLGAGISFSVVAAKLSGRAFAESKATPAPAKKGGAADATLVDEKSPMAQTLKFYQDGSKVPATLRVPKSGVEGVKQNCSGCMFYAKVSGEKAGELGKCQLFPVGLVKGGGWCSSWTKKA